MDRRDFLRFGSATVAVSLARSAMAQQPAKDIGELVEGIRKEHSLPGIAAAAVRGGRIVAEGAAGARRIGQEEKITLDDRFALASCTKRMTSAMIARVIDSGKLTFDTKLAEALPEIPMREDYRTVTVAELLLFAGGIQPYLFFDAAQAAKLAALQGTPREKREQFVKQVLQEEPVVKPGTERRYSNASYAVVAFVAEQRTGKSWEDLMRSEVFEPLGMATAGFGRPRTKERPSEPTLHRKTDTGFEPEPDDRTNFMAVFAPAGDVHCSIRDFARFASYELNAAQGIDSLLKPATAKRHQELLQSRLPLVYPQGKKLKTADGKKDRPKKGPPPAGAGRPFFGGSEYVSSGCILWPEQNLAAIAAVNAGSANEAIRAVFEAVKEREADFS